MTTSKPRKKSRLAKFFAALSCRKAPAIEDGKKGEEKATPEPAVVTEKAVLTPVAEETVAKKKSVDKAETPAASSSADASEKLTPIVKMDVESARTDDSEDESIPTGKPPMRLAAMREAEAEEAPEAEAPVEDETPVEAEVPKAETDAAETEAEEKDAPEETPEEAPDAWKELQESAVKFMSHTEGKERGFEVMFEDFRGFLPVCCNTTNDTVEAREPPEAPEGCIQEQDVLDLELAPTAPSAAPEADADEEEEEEEEEEEREEEEVEEEEEQEEEDVPSVPESTSKISRKSQTSKASSAVNKAATADEALVETVTSKMSQKSEPVGDVTTESVHSKAVSAAE